MCLVRAARHSFKTTVDLQNFIRNVGGLDKDLNDRILGLSPDTIIRDENVIRAWAELLTLRKLPHPHLGYSEVAVWSAVDHLVSIAAIASQRASNNAGTPPADAQLGTLSGSTTTCSPITPQKPPRELPDDTPVHFNSGLHLSTSPQIHAHVDPYLRTELRDTVLKDVRGFSTFFNGITETEWACAISCPEACACQWPESVHNDCAREVEPAAISPVPSFPSTSNPSQRSILDWFTTFNQAISSPRRFYSSPTRALSHSHSSSKRQCDLFLAKRSSATATLPGYTHAWHNVLVPAELKASPSEDCTSDTIVQLAGYVREVFGSQLNRRLVHGFTICGPYFRCYLFDRAGVSISQRLCITKNDRTEALFARILAGYMDMSAQELGFDTHYIYPESTHPDGPVSCMPTSLAHKPAHLLFNGHKFKLLKTLFHRPVIVSRGTLCWLAEDPASGKLCVIKDSWRASWRTSEGQLLALAGDRGVLGISPPLDYGDVKIPGNGSDNDLDSICNLRSGLFYSSATRVILPMRLADGIYFLSTTQCVPVNIEITVSAKRRSGEQLGSEHRKTTKLNSSEQTLTSEASSNQTPTAGASNSSGSLKANSYKSRSATKSGTRSKLSRTSLTNAAVPGTTTEYSTLVDPSRPPGGFMQLTHSVIVTSPIGERIEKFRSIRELLEAFRDAISCTYYLLINSAAAIFNAYLKARPQIPCRIRPNSP